MAVVICCSLRERFAAQSSGTRARPKGERPGKARAGASTKKWKAGEAHRRVSCEARTSSN
jgi:hypothetical protein